QQVMGGRGGRLVVGQAGRVPAGAVPVLGDHLRFVQRDPPGYAVAERLAEDRGVLGEPLRRVPVGPAALVLEFLWQVPVEQRRGRGDAVAGQLVDQRLVVVE